jgi:hypothetical protein
VPRKPEVVDLDSPSSVIGAAAVEAARERGATVVEVGDAVVDALTDAGWRIVQVHPRISLDARARPPSTRAPLNPGA